MSQWLKYSSLKLKVSGSNLNKVDFFPFLFSPLFLFLPSVLLFFFYKPFFSSFISFFLRFFFFNSSNGEFLFQLFSPGMPKMFCFPALNGKIESFFSQELFCLPTLNAEKGYMGPQYPLHINYSIGSG